MRVSLLVVVLLPLVQGQQVLRTFSVVPPATFDPIQSNDPSHFRYFAQLFEGPLEMGMDEKDRCVLAPALCSLPEISKDGLTLTFTVLAGAKFADDECFPGGKGREVTASDVVYSLLRVTDPRWKSPFFAYLQGRIGGLDAWRERAERDQVADYEAPPPGLKAEGDKVVIRLLEPYPQLLPLLTQPWAAMVPREAVNRYGSGFGDHPVGTGPFVLAGKDALGTVRLTRNPGYRIKGRPHLDEVRIEVVEDTMKRTDRFLAGDLHVCDVWPQNEEKLMDRNGRLRLSLRNQGIHFVEGPPLEVGYLVFNFRNMLLAKLPIRQAITLAIDRKKVNRLLFGDRGLIANSPIPPAFVEAAAVDDRPFLYSVPDLTGAKRILAEAGYPEGKGLPEFILDAPGAFAGTRDKGAAESMVQDLAQVGIKVQIRTDSMTKFYERCKTGDLQIAWVSWYADYADVENFLIMFRSDPEDPLKKYNYGFYQNEEFDRLYDQILVKYPGPDRTGLVVKAVEILRKDLPWVFLCHIKRGFLMHKAVQGFRYNVLNQSLRDARLEGGRRG